MIRWNDAPLAPLELHFQKSPSIVNEGGAATAIEEAERILIGEFRLFSFHQVKAGFPPDWQADQLAAVSEELGRSREAKMAKREANCPAAQRRGDVVGCPQGEQGTTRSNELRAEKLPHWTSISDSGRKDIKGVWELSRFPWAFALARAYAATHDPRYQDAFWNLFADWCDRNPPNAGVNWICGQESTFRLMAVLFAVEAMGLPKEETERLTRFVVATGQRIAANLDYALSQKNNHGISECVGLITAALVLRDQPQADRWLRLGLSKLEAQCSELIYPDGSFSQHSLIYHRVLLHDLVWVISRLRYSQLRSFAGRIAFTSRAVG